MNVSKNKKTSFNQLYSSHSTDSIFHFVADIKTSLKHTIHKLEMETFDKQSCLLLFPPVSGDGYFGSML